MQQSPNDGPKRIPNPQPGQVYESARGYQRKVVDFRWSGGRETVRWETPEGTKGQAALRGWMRWVGDQQAELVPEEDWRGES